MLYQAKLVLFIVALIYKMYFMTSILAETKKMTHYSICRTLASHFRSSQYHSVHQLIE